jgi:hypothetical protein
MCIYVYPKVGGRGGGEFNKLEGRYLQTVSYAKRTVALQGSRPY